MFVRRKFLLQFLGAASAIAFSRNAYAQNIAYTYDALGRVVTVTYPNGSTITYSYDLAGNRIQVVQSDNSGFNQIIQVAGSGPVNLRTLANTAGYDGVQNATIVFEVSSSVSVTGAAGTATSENGSPGGIAINTGTWPSGPTLDLTLRIKSGGKVYGGGGAGGSTPPGSWPGRNGGAGGDALNCQHGFKVVVDAGGELRAGGGGAGSGGTGITSWGGPGGGGTLFGRGGGAGGGFPNGAGGAGHNNGSAGTTSGGGNGGAGGTASGSGGSATGGMGGKGGNAGAAGANGASGSGSSGSLAGGTGAAAGFAIRKNGHTVTLTNNGTVSGTVS